MNIILILSNTVSEPTKNHACITGYSSFALLNHPQIVFTTCRTLKQRKTVAFSGNRTHTFGFLNCPSTYTIQLRRLLVGLFYLSARNIFATTYFLPWMTFFFQFYNYRITLRDMNIIHILSRLYFVPRF